MLDTLARTSLWNSGLDYMHGTGHGVGAFLNVHEGPCGISYRTRPDEVPLEEGMILSDGKFSQVHADFALEFRAYINKSDQAQIELKMRSG